MDITQTPNETSAPTQNTGWNSRGYIPHFDRPNLIQHITFHLADSLPKVAILRIQAEVEDEREAYRKIKRLELIHNALDSGYGSCILQEDSAARILEDSLLFGDAVRYRLLHWCIMPNHVHVIIEQMETWPLSKIVQSWKRHTSREIGLLLHGRGGWPDGTPIWQREYFDRFARDEKHYSTMRAYVDNNPVAARLVSCSMDWAWGSARFTVGG